MQGEFGSSCVNGPAVELNDGAFSRLERIMGSDGLARLHASTVVVLGLGGVGSSCTEALARGGVGRLVLVDCDVVQESNINRQALAFLSTVGRRKTEVMRAMVADINPNAQVETYDCFLRDDNAAAFMNDVAADADYVVDAIDTVSAKLAVASWAEVAGVRLVSSMGAANKLHPECLRMADLYDTQNCPLCRAVRKEARKRGIRSLRVLYSCERPFGVSANGDSDRRSRSNLGTASYLPPIMGQTIAGAVLRELAGLEGGKAGWAQ